MLKNLTLRTTIILSLVLGILLPIMIASWLILKDVKARSIRELTEFHESITDILSLGMRDPVWNVFPESGAPFMASVMKDPQVVSIKVETADGEAFLEETNEERKAANGNTVKLVKPIQMEDKKLGNVIVIVNTMKMDKLMADQKKQLVIIVIAQFTVSLLIILFILGNKILTPMDRITEKMKDIARGGGDLTQHVMADSEDEIGTLSKWINEFIGNTRSIVAAIQDSTGTFLQLSGDIEKTASTVGTGAAEQNGSFEELSSSSQECANNANNVDHVTQQVCTDLINVGNDMSVAVESMMSIRQNTKRIEGVVSIITDIADQTNLLALNASIEAARAGEYGRGFAIVADEVRKLAEKSYNATKDIMDIMGGSSEKVAKGADIVENAGTRLKNIIDDMKGLSSEINAITSATEQQASAMEETMSVTERNVVTSEELNNYALNLNDQTNQLICLVERFKV